MKPSPRAHSTRTRRASLSLASSARRLTPPRGVAPSFDDAWLAYRQQCFWPFVAWVFTIGRAWYQPEMQPVDRCLAIIRRTGAAIADLDSFGAMNL